MTKALFVVVDAYIDPRSAEPDQGSHFERKPIKMQDVSLEKLSLIGYDKINQSDEKENTVHYFLDDYRFESIYKNPYDKIERLKKFNAVMSPDFSMFTGYVLPR